MSNPKKGDVETPAAPEVAFYLFFTVLEFSLDKEVEVHGNIRFSNKTVHNKFYEDEEVSHVVFSPPQASVHNPHTSDISSSPQTQIILGKVMV